MSEYGVKVLIFAGVAVSGLVVVHTIRQYLKQRKYRHINGPKTRGYFTGGSHFSSLTFISPDET